MERPLLKLDPPRRGTRAAGNPAFQPPKRISRRRGTGLPPKFTRLAAVLENIDGKLPLTTSPDEIAPERALVFETNGTVGEFMTAVKNVAGLEFLFDQNTVFEPTEEFHHLDEDGTRAEDGIKGCLYMAMPNVAALKQLISLWGRYQAGEDLPRGLKGWKRVFENLRDIRVWGPQDRILPDMEFRIRDHLMVTPDAPLRCEVELWFRANDTARASETQHLTQELAKTGSSLLHSAEIPEIAYSGALVSLTPAALRQVLDEPEQSIAALSDVMYIKPQSVVQFPNEEIDENLVTEAEEATEDAADELPAPPLPIAAVIDGVPMQNHILLRDRLIVEDPDGLEADTPVAARRHGTAMASFIIHGDRNIASPVLNERIVMHPVLKATQWPDGTWEEYMPDNRLAIDTIYRAIRRIKIGEAGVDPIAPSVVIFNHSLGDTLKPYHGRISAWARLLDFVSHRYRVLILTSAGNIRERIRLPEFENETAFEAANEDERSRAIISAIDRHKAVRSVLSPAEAMNVITVGGWHNDNNTTPIGGRGIYDPFPRKNFTGLTSALGLGYGRSIKPDIVYDGGRVLVRTVPRDDGLYIEAARASQFHGQRAAIPDPHGGGDVSKEYYSCGTSNATALMTRNAVRVYRALEEIAGGNINAMIPDVYQAVVLKTLLVHCCAWGEHGENIQAIIGPALGNLHVQRNENAARYLGHGYPNIDKVIECAQNRVTFFQFGQLSADDAHHYELDLPPSLEGNRELRRVTLTSAWLTPVNPKHQGYRHASIEISPTADQAFSLGVTRIRMQPHSDATTRGTSFHEVLQGERAVPYVDDGKLKFTVSCRASAGTLEAAVPYAVAVTVEVAETSAIDVYQEVRSIIEDRVRTRTRPNIRT